MKKEALLKKFIVLFLCFLFLLSAGLMSMRSCETRAKRGDGQDGQILSFEEFLSMFESLSPRFSLHDNDHLEAPDSEGRSGVMLEMRFSSYRREAYYGNSVSLNHTAKITVCGEATLYELDSILSAPDRNLYLDMQIYRDRAQEFLRFERFSYANGGRRISFPKALLGRWLDLSESEPTEIYEALSLLDDKYYGVISAIAKTYESIDEREVERSGKKFLLDRSALNRLGTFILALEGISTENNHGTFEQNGFEGEFAIDLSNAKRPEMSFSLEAENNIRTDDGRNAEFSYFYLEQSGEYLFSALDNTEIQTPNRVKKISREEFESDWRGNES